MQNFFNEWGIKRRIDIQTMEMKEVDDHYNQFNQLSKDEKKLKKRELKLRIKENKGKNEFSNWILSIKDKRGKIIGKMEVYDMGNNKAFLSVEIPNESWILKYGAESIDQFRKICSKNKLFEEIEINPKDAAVNLYQQQHGMEDEDCIIKIA